MTNFNKVLSILALGVALSLGTNNLDAQTTPTSTTFSAAVAGPSGSGGSAQTTVCLTSSTGVSAPGFGQTPLTLLFSGREAMAVNAATSSSSCWLVTRGWAGTKPYAHNSGDLVYVGPTGGFNNSPFVNSAPGGGAGSPCTATTQSYLPIIVVGSVGNNQQNGGVWNCFSSAGVQATSTGLWYMTNAPEDGPALTDFEIFVPATGICSSNITTGSAGTGNATTVLDGSVPAFKLSSTASAAGLNLDCNLTAAMRTLAGKGITLTNMSVIYSIQTTTATSMSTPTISLFNAPAASTSETASSATLVTTAALVGGTLTMTPPVASANLTAVSAGQYYTQNISLGTPIQMNSDLRTYVFHFQVNQSASAIQIMTVPGIWLRGTYIPF